MSVFFLDDFAVRQWDDPDYKGTRIPKSTAKESFLQKMHEYYEQVRTSCYTGKLHGTCAYMYSGQDETCVYRP